MKSIFLILSFLLFLPFTNQGQDKDLKKLFNQYKNVAGFSLETDQGDVDFNLDSDWDFASFLNRIENIYVLGFDQKSGKKSDLQSFNEKLDKLMDKKAFKAMIDMEGDSRFALFTLKNKDGNTTDALMIAQDDDETSFIWVSGE